MTTGRPAMTRDDIVLLGCGLIILLICAAVGLN